MGWKKEYLDVVLVPSGLLIMFGYQLFLVYRCLKLPHTTVIGYENHNKGAWVDRMMQVECKDKGLAITVIGTNISAASNLSSISLALSSLTGTWIGSSSNNIFVSSLIYGDTRPCTISLKYISLLACFLVAFASFVQSARNFVHANFLISMPNTDLPVNCVQKAVIRGGACWSVGLRALYFATVLMFWIFGPIPMFVSSVIMVMICYNLDMNSTPLHEYQPATTSHNLSNKIDEEMSCVARVIQHHGRPHGNGSKTV